MDSTVIKEIADQLGMAVDQAGQFIAEHLPEFAAMKSIYPLCWIIGAVICGIISAIVFIKSLQAFRQESSKDNILSERIEIELSALMGLLIGSAVLIVCIVVAAVNAPVLISWLLYPEASLLNMAMRVV